MSVEASRIRADNGNALKLLAYCRTAAAEYALLVVSYHVNRGVVNHAFSLNTRKRIFIVKSVVARKLLKLALSASDAGETFLLMIRKQKLERCFSRLDNSRCVCEYFHSLVYGEYARGYEASCALDLDYAYTARADCVDIL